MRFCRDQPKSEGASVLLARAGSCGGRVRSAGYQFYPIEITFQRISDPKVRAYYMNLPTSFALEETDVDNLRTIAGELMRANPLYRKLLQDLGATADDADSAP
jgi:NTE family protein